MDSKNFNTTIHLRFHGPYLRQSFSVPDSLIYYITMNPSTPKIYQKLVKSCKYFFSKNAIFIFDSLNHYIYYGKGGKIYGEKMKKWIKFDMTQISTKLWITNTFTIFQNNSNVLSTLIPKIYRCDATHIHLNKQEIFLNDFMTLAKSVKYFTQTNTKILNSNGTELFMEEIVAILPNLKEFRFLLKNNYSSKTINTLLKLPNFPNIRLLKLNGLTEDFDIDSIYKYSKENKGTKFHLYFKESISHEFKDRLEKIIDEIIESAIENYVPIFISYLGIDEEKENRIFDLILN